MLVDSVLTTQKHVRSMQMFVVSDLTAARPVRGFTTPFWLPKACYEACRVSESLFWLQQTLLEACTGSCTPF